MNPWIISGLVACAIAGLVLFRMTRKCHLEGCARRGTAYRALTRGQRTVGRWFCGSHVTQVDDACRAQGFIPTIYDDWDDIEAEVQKEDPS